MHFIGLFVLQCFLFIQGEQCSQPPVRANEEWMLICRHNADLQPNIDSQQDFDWTHAAQAYPNLEEMPSFIPRQQESAAASVFTTSADPQHLQGKQLMVYTIVQEHLEADSQPPLRMIVSGQCLCTIMLLVSLLKY